MVHRRLPAEWEPQAGVMLVWPHADSDWAEELASAEEAYVAIACAILVRQSLLVICHDENVRDGVRRLLAEREGARQRLRLAIVPSNDTWVRDFGPLTVLRADSPELIDFRFNAWGGKFASDLDDRVVARLHGQGVFSDPLYSSDLILEGGALEVDGQGTLLATRSSVITASRNGALDQSGVEVRLHELLGIERCLWLEHGHLDGDDTDGHIDTLARFCDPQTLVHVTAAPDDPDHDEVAAMIDELRGLRGVDGQPLRLVALPPAPQLHDPEDGRRLAASYANFLVINGAVLLPVYGAEQDGEAVVVLERCFPGREIVPIDCRPLIRQNGSLHCVTMQLPVGIMIGGQSIAEIEA